MAGEHADHYRVNADRTNGVALFREDQTQFIGDRDAKYADCVQVISREEWEAHKREAKRPVAKVRQDGDRFEIWIGRNKDAAKHLRDHGWKFNRAQNRWCARTSVDVAAVQAALEQLGCRVEVEA